MDTVLDDDRLPSVISPIVHVSSMDLCVSLVPVSTTTVDSGRDDRLLAFLLKRSSSLSIPHDSVTSDYTFYSATDSPAGLTPVLHPIPIPDK